MAATSVLMMRLGLPDSSRTQDAADTGPTGGGKMTMTLDEQDPRLTFPVQDRFRAERLDTALQVVLNSVAFRSSSQDLTAWGTYTRWRAVSPSPPCSRWPS